MKSVLTLFVFMTVLMSCTNKNYTKQVDDAYAVLDSSFVEFKAGNNEVAKKLSNEVLSVGLELEHDTLTGYALMNLCRTALREKDEIELNKYGDQLSKLASKTKDQSWEMYRAHMYAELARMNGDMDKAVELYNISLKISDSIGAKEMYAVEHFNMSMVEMSRGNLMEAKNLIKRYYDLMKEIYPESDDVHGLIPIANLLLHKNDLYGAAEVSIASRRLFKENDIVPDPADEEPLLRVEEKYKKELSQNVQDSLKVTAESLTVDSILTKYLKE